MDAEATIQAYYEALRCGDPLSPYFAQDDAVVKIGLTEQLRGFDDVQHGLQAQTDTTEAWTVNSTRLRTTERDRYAWFFDIVELSWSNIELDDTIAASTRWSGTLCRGPDQTELGTPWRFVEMHVSKAASRPEMVVDASKNDTHISPGESHRASQGQREGRLDKSRSE